MSQSLSFFSSARMSTKRPQVFCEFCPKPWMKTTAVSFLLLRYSWTPGRSRSTASSLGAMPAISSAKPSKARPTARGKLAVALPMPPPRPNGRSFRAIKGNIAIRRPTLVAAANSSAAVPMTPVSLKLVSSAMDLPPFRSFLAPAMPALPGCSWTVQCLDNLSQRVGCRRLRVRLSEPIGDGDQPPGRNFDESCRVLRRLAVTVG